MSREHIPLLFKPSPLGMTSYPMVRSGKKSDLEKQREEKHCTTERWAGEETTHGAWIGVSEAQHSFIN